MEEKAPGNPRIEHAVKIIAVSMSLFHLYTGLFGTLEAMQQRSLHLIFSLLLVFLTTPTKKDGRGLSWFDFTLIGLVIGSGGYIFVLHGVIEGITGGIAPYEIVLGVLFTSVVLVATYRTIGWAMVIIALIFIAYSFVGPYLPEMISHRGFSLEDTFQQLYIFHEGIFGTPLGVSATFVVLFIIRFDGVCFMCHFVQQFFDHLFFAV